jgi:hypothetical protein
VAGGGPGMLVRDTCGWGESQAGGIRFYTLRLLRPRLVLRDTRGWAGSPRLVLRDTRGWGASQAGDIRFYTLRCLRPRLVLRDTRGWVRLRLGTLGFIPCDTCVPGWYLGIRVAGCVSGWGH